MVSFIATSVSMITVHNFLIHIHANITAYSSACYECGKYWSYQNSQQEQVTTMKIITEESSADAVKELFKLHF